MKAIIEFFLDLIDWLLKRNATPDNGKVPNATGLKIKDAVSRAPDHVLDSIVYDDDPDLHREGG